MINNPLENQQAIEVTRPFLTMDLAKMTLDSVNVGIWILDAATWNFLPFPRTKFLFGFLPDEDMSFDDAC